MNVLVQYGIVQKCARSVHLSLLFVNRINLQQVSIKNRLSVVYTPILIAFYMIPTKLVQLILLREIFQKNGYPENFVDRYFKLFFNRIDILKENVPTVEKKPLRLVLSYQGLYHYELGLNCKSPSKGYLTDINYRLFLKDKINSLTIFALKTLFPKFSHQVWFVSFSVDYAMNSITENVLDILL